MSTRAAIQPSPKNRAGIGSSHHSSKSMFAGGGPVLAAAEGHAAPAGSESARGSFESARRRPSEPGGSFPARCRSAPGRPAARRSGCAARGAADRAAATAVPSGRRRRASPAAAPSRERDQDHEDERCLPAPPMENLSVTSSEFCSDRNRSARKSVLPTAQRKTCIASSTKGNGRHRQGRAGAPASACRAGHLMVLSNRRAPATPCRP